MNHSFAEIGSQVTSMILLGLSLELAVPEPLIWVRIEQTIAPDQQQFYELVGQMYLQLTAAGHNFLSIITSWITKNAGVYTYFRKEGNRIFIG